MKTTVLVAVMVLVGVSQVGWADSPLLGVSVRGNMYVSYGDPYHWEPVVWAMSFESDPGNYLYAAPGAEFGINLDGTPTPGAYKGVGVIFLGSAVEAFDFDVGAVQPPNAFGNNSLALQLWAIPYEWGKAGYVAWSSVGPWGPEPRHVHLDTETLAGYAFRIAVVPEPPGICCVLLGAGALLSVRGRRR